MHVYVHTCMCTKQGVYIPCCICMLQIFVDKHIHVCSSTVKKKASEHFLWLEN